VCVCVPLRLPCSTAASSASSGANISNLLLFDGKIGGLASAALKSARDEDEDTELTRNGRCRLQEQSAAIEHGARA